MNNIRLTVFDIFSYTVPGFCYIILFAFGLEKIDLNSFVETTSKLSIYTILAYSLLSYIIGFIFDVFADKIIIKLIDLLQGDLKERVLSEFNRENPQFALTEYHFSKLYSSIDVQVSKAREKVDQYSAMSGLARNLSLAFLTFTFTSISFTIIHFYNIQWSLFIIKILTGFAISLVLMLQTDTFRRWSHYHLLCDFYIVKKTNRRTHI